MTQQTYTVAEAAKIFNVKEATIRQWLYEGKIKAYKEGFWRVKIPQSEINRVTQDRMTKEKYVSPKKKKLDFSTGNA